MDATTHSRDIPRSDPCGIEAHEWQTLLPSYDLSIQVKLAGIAQRRLDVVCCNLPQRIR